jgi:hypothetical protein
MRTQVITNTVRRVAGVILTLSLAMPAAAQDVGSDFRQLAVSLAPGTRIELDLADGTHVEGTVLGQEGDRLVFSPRTRLPVAPWRIDYSEIRSLEQKAKAEGMRPGTKVLLGIGIGFGVALILAGIAAAASS